MQSGTEKKSIYGFLAVVAVCLSGYALFFGDRGLLLIFLIVSVTFAGILWSSFGFAIRDIPYILTFLLKMMCVLGALYGAYVLVNPGYRVSLTEQREKSADAAVEKIETEKSVAQLVEGMSLTEEHVDGYRIGKMLIMFQRRDTPHLAVIVDSPYISSSQDDFYVQVLDKGSTTSNLRDAGTIVWIQEDSEVVGSYNRKLLGPITADKTGDALKITWKVWLIDVNKRIVIAYREFIGPDPPESIEGSGDFGVPPQEDLAAWLEGMPMR